MAPPVKQAGAKRSFVWDYFEPVGTDTDSSDSAKKKKCKKCAFACTPRTGSTSSMAFHLLHSHGISKESHTHSQQALGESEQDQARASASASKLVKQPSVTSFCATKNRSAEEWCTRQVVMDGLSLRQLAQSEFQRAACTAMRLKHFKSAGAVGKIVMEHIAKMKEDTKKDLAEQLKAGERLSVIADEWTSIRNRRYLNVCVKTSKYTANLGLVWCRGSVTSKAVAEMVKVSLVIFSLCSKIGYVYIRVSNGLVIVS
jgi:hypothetical protein